ncbi:hypothetical protein Xoosp2_4 [Xanthomonas phage Xoo-sp2]|uniref:Uncharacterized protein n=1 Tax=Xanthomonas phage Xoo-sp2 TaxID=1852622 RepID=A0A1X9IAL3_9CAUD|nr:hypothetical protein JTY55_gp04 [Xanthomonas phage Xoo-sp2]ANT45226.1 hypothetical protein Xoosp2_4 [Xanthomonas phage Xoo-sp2]
MAKLNSETGLIKPYIEAEITLAGKNGNVTGDGPDGSYCRSARLTRYLRLMGPVSSRNGAGIGSKELAGALIGHGIVLKTFPDFLVAPPLGLKPYTPQRDNAERYRQALVLEALTMLDDALKPYLEPGTAEPWAKSLSASSEIARDQLGD